MLNALKRNKNNICVILVTLLLTTIIMYFNVYRFSGYKVCVGSSTITFVKSKKEFNKTFLELQNEIKTKYRNVIIKKDFTLDKVKVDDEAMFINGDSLKKIILKKFNIVADALLMKSDDRKVAYVTSENQGKEILNSVKDYYVKRTKLNSIKEVHIENKISYDYVKVKIGDLYEKDMVIKSLIEYNNRAQRPLVNIKVIGNVTKEQVIYPITIMKSSNKLMSGVNKVVSAGMDGIKRVTTEIITLNNNTISEKLIKSEVTTPVQNKEILVGTYTPVILQLGYMNRPSRGSISSIFGMRWGKMHKGIDIAANFGAVINAALDGTITYAAWQDGYGNVIKINHGNGIETTYAHCSAIAVKKGQVVSKGEKIGEVGSTGNSTGPHLHFEVREDGKPKNPQSYIK
jgi:hypothetical protein